MSSPSDINNSDFNTGSGLMKSPGSSQASIGQADSARSVARPSARDAAPTLASAEQIPAEFVHLQTAIESKILQREKPSELALNAMAEEGLSQDKPYVLGVTSAIGGEGKTTTALHLALAMAQNSFKRICLMDFSLDSDGTGDIGDRLGLYPREAHELAEGEESKPQPCGIIDILEERASALSSFQMSEPENLTVVPAGKGARRPARIARSPRVKQIIASAKHAFDVIIVDMPSVSTENALPLSRHMDGVMIVVHSGVTPRDLVQRSIDVLGRDRVVGVAMNRHTSHIPSWLVKLLKL